MGVPRALLLMSASACRLWFDPVPSTGDAAPDEAAVTGPSDQSVVTGAVTIAASVRGDTPIANVQFELDHAPIGGAVLAAPYTLAWDTTTASDGAHTLGAIATDVSGGTVTSPSIVVVVP